MSGFSENIVAKVRESGSAVALAGESVGQDALHPQAPMANNHNVAVLHVFAFFRPDFTGEGIYLERVSPYLRQLGISNDLVVERTATPTNPVTAGAIAQIRYFGDGDRSQRRFLPRMYLWLIANLPRYTVVHFHAPVGRLFLLHIIVKLFGCRIVQSCTLSDSLEEIIQGYRGKLRPLVRRLCRLIDTMVAISPGLRDRCTTVLPASRVRLVPQGTRVPELIPGERERLREQHNIGADETVLLFVGGICARKDPKFLVVNLAACKGASRIRLLLVGPVLESDYAEELNRAIAESDLRDNVSQAGYVEDPSPYYRLADIFVFASHEEGFGNVLLEAMAHGLPVVSRRLPGVTDYFIDDGSSGYLFETAEDYRRIVGQLAEDRERRLKVGAAAREAVIAEFDICRIAERYAQIYRNDEPTS